MTSNQESTSPICSTPDHYPGGGIPKWRRVANAGFGLIMLGLFSYYVWLFSTAERRVTSKCSEVAVGMSRQDVERFAAANGLRKPSARGSTTFIVEEATYGRFGCRIEWRNDLVVTSVYDFQG